MKKAHVYCRCGRRWFPRWISRYGYQRICPGCDKACSTCTCATLGEQ